MSDLEVRLKYCKSETDDWTKVEDKALRKKIQNRLAKRKNRAAAPKDRSNKKNEQYLQHQRRPEDSGRDAEESVSSRDASSEVLTVSASSQSETKLSGIVSQLQAFFATPGLAEHRFIRLTQYSLARALVQNANMLALAPGLFADDESLSPWTSTNPYPTLAPHTLTPTTLQLSTPHHPYLDILASPSLRDNILLTLLSEEQEEELCYEIHADSFTVWGSQPWNFMAWEISQAFMSKWAWLLDDDTVRCSNFWRAERGESPLVVPDLGVGLQGEVV
ncbi:hypothetical protein MMC28_010508 [Mycoblastus sanguinarius]|nr:hypothetical protein [Mycoblastus sanguinarius]